jgi:GT2 family glycosyltransferase
MPPPVDIPISVSAIIPNYNSGPALAQCLQSLERSGGKLYECIVVDDASTDGSASAAIWRGVRVLSTGRRRGPAYARNLGASVASGDVLLFLDADVCVHPDTVERITKRFAGDPDLDALMGSYDDNPAARDFLSQYRNLLHCFVHQTGNPRASTFWSGCGAIRRSVFVAHGGFDTRYSLPSVEEVELGYRLRAAGRQIALDRETRVRHLKHWSLPGLLRTDVFRRGVPWTRLILKSRCMPNDLNLRWSQRISVASCGLAGVLASLATLQPGTAALNVPFFVFLLARKGPGFALSALPAHLLFFLYSGFSFVLGVAIEAWPCSALRRRSPGLFEKAAGLLLYGRAGRL